MDKETYGVLAKVRIERAEELVEEAQELLKALLAMKEIDADSHNGCLRQFNVHYIKDQIGGFKAGDYKRIANTQRIRNNSDYDDFYIADKKECQEQVKMAVEFLYKAKAFINNSN